MADGDFRSEDPSDESLTAVVVVVMWLALFRLLSDACETLLEDVDLCRARRNRSRIAIVVIFFFYIPAESGGGCSGAAVVCAGGFRLWVGEVVS